MTISNQIISFKLSGINYSGTSTALNYTAGVTTGVCLASKALVVDSNKGLTGIGSLSIDGLVTASTFAGTLTTASQPNITSIGTLTNSTISGNLLLNGHNGTTTGLILASILVTATAPQLNYNNITSIGVGQASKTLVLDASRNINNINSLTTTNLVTTNLTLGGTQLNITGAQINYSSVTTPGIAEASKSLVLNSSSNITGINSLSSTTITATNLNGTLQTASQPNITSIGTLSSLTLNGGITGLTDLSLTGNLTGANTISATNLAGLLTTAAQPNITSVGTLNNLTVNGTLTTSAVNVTTLSLNSVAVTATSAQINTLTGVTAGSVLASKVLVVDASRNLVNLNSLTATSLVATNLTGSLQTSAQPNITSVGTLNGLVLSGTITGLTDLTMSGTLSGASVLSATTLIGLLSTAAQTNITSLGVLSSLRVTSNLALGTTTPARQMEINSSSGNCLRLSYNAPTGAATSYADFLINSGGDLLLSSSSNIINLSSKVIIGGNSSINELQFNGVTGDIGKTYITERLYSSDDFSELLIYKGNDTSGVSGPDRIRMRAGEIRFQVFSISEEYASFIDGDDAMVIANNGRIGINTTLPDRQLEINSSSGNCLRLTYNDNSGSAVGYTDFTVTSSGQLYLKSANNSVVIGSSANISQEFFVGSASTSATVGMIRICNSAGVNYIQSGVNTITGSSADIVISDYYQTISTSARKIIFKSNGKVGFGTSVPSKQLDINASDGECLRLSFNASAGSATTYCDYSLTTVGQMNFTVAGSAPSFVFSGASVSAIIATAAQPNITSVGTLTSLALSGAVSGVTNLSMSGNLTGATSITATSLVGTIATAAQPNITSVGILPNLLVSTNAKFGVVSSTPQDIVHIEGSVNDFIGLQIENRNATAASSGTKISFAGFSSSNDNYEIARIAAITSTSGTPSSFQFGSLGFYTRGTDLSTNADERMRITNTGNVGIGMTTPLYSLDVNGVARSLQLLVGTSTDTSSTRLISALDSNIGTGIRYITLGKANSTNNQFEIGYNHKIDSSATNVAFLGFTGGSASTRLYILASGLSGFGTSNASKQLEINHITGDCLRLSYNAPNGSATTYSDLLVSSNGNLILNPSGTFVTSSKRIQTTVSGYGFSHLVSSCELGSYVDGTLGYFGTTTSHNFNLMTGGATRMTISTTGNVGVGTSAPTYKFDVNGTAQVTQLLVGTSVDNTTSRLISALDSSIANGVSKYITLGKATSTNNQFEIGYNHVSDGSTTNRGSFGFFGTGSILNILANGNVGIGTTTPTVPLDVSDSSSISVGANWNYNSSGGQSASGGTVAISAKFSSNVTLAGSLYVTSDKRLKQDLINLESDYCKRFIMETTPIQFKYKNNLHQIYNGYTAQEIFKAGFTNLISIIPEDGLEENIDEDGFKSIKNEKMILTYEGIIPILAKNIKNLYEDNEILKNENIELKQTINNILERLNNLESN